MTELPALAGESDDRAGRSGKVRWAPPLSPIHSTTSKTLPHPNGRQSMDSNPGEQPLGPTGEPKLARLLQGGEGEGAY